MTNDILRSEFYRLTFAYLEQLGDNEREWAVSFLMQMTSLLEGSMAAVTPMTIARLDSIIQEYLAVRRLITLKTEEPFEPSAKTEKPARSSVSTSEAAGKARDRLRKAIAELEELCVQTDPGAMGLADALRPLILDAKKAQEEGQCQVKEPPTAC